MSKLKKTGAKIKKIGFAQTIRDTTVVACGRFYDVDFCCVFANDISKDALPDLRWGGAKAKPTPERAQPVSFGSHVVSKEWYCHAFLDA